MSDLLTKAVNAAHRVDDVQRLQAAFHDHIVSANRASTVPGMVIADAEKIVVQCLGHTVTAIPRTVKDDDDQEWFCIEYDFRIEFRGESISIWSASLKPNGSQPFFQSDGTRICDLTNPHMRQHLLTYVSLALLDSPVFKKGAGQPLKVKVL